MRILLRASYFLSGVTMLAVLTACSVGGATAPGGITAANPGAGLQSIASFGREPIPAMLARPGPVLPAAQLMFGDPYPADAAAATSSVYVGQFQPSTTNLYTLPDTKNVAPQCTIATQYVNGIGVNAAGTLYIPQGAINQITTYVKGTCTPAPFKLSDPNGQPVDVAFASNGTTYVADAFGPTGGAGNISVYPKGQKTPSFKLTDSSISECLGIAVDKADDVFLSYVNISGANSLIVFVKGKMPGKVHAIAGNSFIIGLEFDAKQNLIAIDDGGGTVLTYAPPYTGVPKNSFFTKSGSAEGKLDSTGKTLYVGDFVAGTVDVYSYPSGSYRYSISNGLTQSNTVQGIGVEPPLPN